MKRLSASDPVDRISRFFRDVNPVLFHCLDDYVGTLDASYSRLALVLETVRIEETVKEIGRRGGRPFVFRKVMARAFLAKATLNIPTTKALVQRLRTDPRLKLLCGFESSVPSESTFSRCFSSLSLTGELNQVHEEAVKRHLGTSIVHHVCRDSTAIEARERALSKPKPPPKVKKKMGPSGKPRELTRLEKQGDQDPVSALKELPTACDTGAKRNSKGRPSYWVGYKLHLDVSEGGIPLSAFTSSASLHDSQVAIPLSKITSSRVGAVLYELMDKGYDAGAIRKALQMQGHVPLIEAAGKRNGPGVPFDFAEEKRYRIRTTVERTFSDLKDNHGGRLIRVRGSRKVHTHLMFGVLSIFGLALIPKP